MSYATFVKDWFDYVEGKRDMIEWIVRYDQLDCEELNT